MEQKTEVLFNKIRPLNKKLKISHRLINLNYPASD